MDREWRERFSNELRQAYQSELGQGTGVATSLVNPPPETR